MEYIFISIWGGTKALLKMTISMAKDFKFCTTKAHTKGTSSTGLSKTKGYILTVRTMFMKALGNLA
jgi:hypothetical protein